MPTPSFIRVALPVPLYREFDYLPPTGTDASSLRPGCRVVVPFGRQQLVGIITELPTSTTIDATKLKVAIEALDQTPQIPGDVAELCRWAASYYQAPIGEALFTALPILMRTRNRTRAKTNRRWRLHVDAAGLADSALKRAPKQQAALASVTQHNPLSDSMRRSLKINLATLDALVKRHLLVVESVTESDPTPQPAGPISQALRLNPQQAQALEALTQNLATFCCNLVEGITGSGKTEVYLQLIEQVLNAGKQALVLIPEIGLTPQTEQRFRARFGDGVYVIHSGLSDRQRLGAWQACATAQARVLIGTRSAVFTPLPKLGVIIVDEEHDISFKQQEGFRYSARDIAVYRARLHDIPVVLGSATPSCESIVNTNEGRYRHIQLTERAGNAQPPQFSLFDAREHRLEGGIAQPLLDDIQATLGAGHQVLVFINRRGWAPVLTCNDCGWIAGCNQCDARMTLHRQLNRLWCHHCDTRGLIPAQCPACMSARLTALGVGTERVEHRLQRHFPTTPIRRIDRNSMQSRDAMEGLINEVNSGDPCILVGTQMLAKGHHFSKVTLVVVLDIDAGLFSADFRAPERTAQLLLQVAGRAGRDKDPGRVIIQTQYPKHPWFQQLLAGGYRAFIDPLLMQRRKADMPPYAAVALIRADSTEAAEANRLLEQIRSQLERELSGVDIIGPLPTLMQRKGGRHRFQLLLRGGNRAVLHRCLNGARVHLMQTPLGKHLRWHIDVDPQADF